jgi:hypothetical protein
VTAVQRRSLALSKSNGDESVSHMNTYKLVKRFKGERISVVDDVRFEFS